ncbi:Flp pilus assembly complex ATPase component TadA [Ideonella sp. 4Y11]|uniref:Flp pilus assembly complex ATPase component TadA n=1 Tax=Ideonella aquatica TaxID=2824119 RepID=A0A940YT10_9BURK|nr:GspE/PulE family protein [Ideonella aquatica]MBQ0958825.1 Flp pilus assembly complex ATPase component TadA [Ideonella aquatica]
MARPERVRLGDLLIKEGLLAPEQLERALEEQRRTGRKLGRTFVDNGWVTEEQVARLIARQLGMPFVELQPQSLRPELIKLLPEVQARRLRAVVLSEEGASLRVGMADPTDIGAYDELGRLLRRPIEVSVVTEGAFLAAIERSYQRSDEIAGLARELTSELGAADTRLADVLGLGNLGAEDAPVVRLLTSVFEEALRVRASDIHIEPQERQLRIRFRIDGLLRVQTETDAKIAGAVALRLKLMSGLDISEKRLPQDGRFAVKLAGGTVDVRISTLPTQHGESVVMRLLNQNAGLLELDRLHMPERVLAALRRAIARPSGMVLVTGPTGSGKTTTLYAALNQLNSTDRKILTAEDPVEYRLPGLNQVQVQEKIDLSFERVLRAALRQDPDVVLIGEMRDQETAEIGMRAAITGHLVLSTLHTNDALSTPVRLLDMGVPRYMVALSLQMVLAQRLVRVICPSCKAPAEPTPAEAQFIESELGDRAADTPFWRGRGCALCNHTGYSGRTGIYEFVEMTQELVEALNHGEAQAFTQAARRQMGGHTLRRDAVRLAIDGRSTLEEAMRATNQVDEG